MALMGSIHAAMLTMAMGSTRRIPNTAMTMPQVKNQWREGSFIFSRYLALTTALSKLTDVSSTPSTAALTM